jgi:hypothetical protein
MRTAVLLIVLAVGLMLACEVSSGSGQVTYYLPLEYGDSRKIFQGNGGSLSHNDVWNQYAWDFSPMPVGTPVVAAADGVVTFVKEDTEGPTGNHQDNNKVIVRHADGNVSEYLHIKQNGAMVEKGQKILRGDLIAFSGNTGNSGGPHLHFGLRRGHHITGKSVPCKFADVHGDGVPKKDDIVISKNFPVRYRKEYDEIEQILTLYSRCSDFGCLEAVAKELKSFTKIEIPMPLAVLKGAIKKRDDLIAEYEKAALDALGKLTAAMESSEIDTAIRLACFGEKDFVQSEKVLDFKKVHTELRKEQDYKEASDKLNAERTYRTKVAKAVKKEMRVRTKLNKGAKASYKGVISAYEQAAECASDDSISTNLRRHIEELKRLEEKESSNK